MSMRFLTVAFAWPLFILKTESLQLAPVEHYGENGGTIDWELCNSEVYSNLGGLGGYNVAAADAGNGKKELRYKNIATLADGHKIDMVITNTTAYLPNPDNPKLAAQAGDPNIGGQWMNGKLGCLGRFNIYSPGDVTLKFSLVYAGTDTVIPPSSHDFTIFDFDTSTHGMVEEITAKGIDSYYTARIEPVVQGDSYIFSGAASVQVDNPSDRFDLTHEQLAATVGLVYSTSEWELKFAGVGTTKAGERDREKKERGEREKKEREEREKKEREEREKKERDREGKKAERQEEREDKKGEREDKKAERQEERGERREERGERRGNEAMETEETEEIEDTVVEVGGRNFLFAGRSAVQKQGTPMGICEIYGDPHIVGFDKMARGVDTAAHVTDTGDFWLVKSHDLGIQGRYGTVDAWETGQVGLSTLVVGGGLLGGGKLVVERKHGVVTCFGETIAPQQNYIKTITSGTIKIAITSTGADITLPYQTSLRIERYDTHLVAKITMPAPAGGTDGHCGNFNGDPADDTLQEIEKRTTVRVADSESLLK